MIKLGQNIRRLRKEKRMSLAGLEAELVKLFKEKALRYNTLYRIEKGLRIARLSSLSQICAGLGVTLKELRRGTDEERLMLVDYIKKHDLAAQYAYSKDAYAQILTKEKQPFLAARLVLEPRAKTKLEQDPPALGKFQKWVYGLKGKITCVIGKDRYTIRKDDALCFESRIPHYFQNNTAKKSSCIIIQNPKHI